jgi:hypothetical protein
MKSLELSQGQFETLSNLLKNDIEDLADSPTFFTDCGFDPKEYIDEHIALCEIFGIDFWNVADLFCNHFAYSRLKALYEGKSIQEFMETYRVPNSAENARNLLKALLKVKKSDRQ